MQATTPELAAAISADVRYPLARVKVDWLGDGSFGAYDPGYFADTFTDTFDGIGDIADLGRFLDTSEIVRTLTGDLPDDARQLAGSAAATATIAVEGGLDLGFDLSQALTPFGGAGSSIRRVTTRITVDYGFQGSNGAEYLRQFTGKLRSVEVDPDTGQVTLQAVDNVELFRIPVMLPVFIGDDNGNNIDTVKRPGFNASWLIDWIARSQGFYQAPPVRSKPQVSATLCGSAWPEFGLLTNASEQSTDPASGWFGTRAVVGPVTFGPLGPSMGLQAGSTADISRGTAVATYHLPANVGPNTGQNIFIQMHRVRFTDNGELSQISLVLQDFTDDDELQFILTNGGGAGTHILVQYNRPTLQFGSFTAFGSGYGNVDYIGCHVAFTSTGAIIRIRVNGVETSSTVVDSGTKAGNAPWARAILTATGIEGAAAGLQITSEAYSAGMWDDDFVATAVCEPSLNDLIGTPPVDSTDPFAIEQELAAAEQGVVLFDENGRFVFYNRNHLVGQVPMLTITADPAAGTTNLKERSSSEEVDAVRNRISVPATPVLLDPAPVALWDLGELVQVPAQGRVREPAEFPGAVYRFTSITYQAAQLADGSGGDVTNLKVSTEQVSATAYDIVVDNPNGFPVYLVNNSTSALGDRGEPALHVVGQCIRPSESTYTAVALDGVSADPVAGYGVQALDVPANVFRQRAKSATDLANGLLSILSQPHGVLGSTEIVGDPRVQLGDLALVHDRDGLLLHDNFWVVGSTRRFSVETGLAETVDLRGTVSTDPFFPWSASHLEAGVGDWLVVGGAGSVASSTTHARSGTKSGLVTWGTGAAFSQGVGALATGLIVGRNYTVSGWVWVPAGSPAVYIAGFFVGLTSTPTGTTGGWEFVSVTFTATSTQHYVAFGNQTASTAGQQAWFDDVSIVLA